MHVTASRALLALTRADEGVDSSRAQAIRDIRTRHPGEKVIAFSQFADTVHALFSELRSHRGVAALTARGGRIASGRLSRQETLTRFAPRATGAPAASEAERIDLLLTTDLASEGLNLHDASVVVHLDLPWTPARLEQRVARSRRLGALHTRTHSYALAPPADAGDGARDRATAAAEAAHDGRGDRKHRRGTAGTDRERRDCRHA